MLWNSNLLPIQITDIFLVHTLASALATVTLHSLLPKQYRASRIWGWIFFFSIAFFIPLLGSLCLGGVVIPALCWPKRIKESNSLKQQYVKIPDLPFRSPNTKYGDICCGEATLKGIIQCAPDPDKRLKAVLETLKLQDKDAILLLRLALKDAEDDVRLLAYALLDRKEQAITARIRAKLCRLKTAATVDNYHLHKAIAHEYWELVHLGLAQGEVLTHVLDSARKHTEDALMLSANDVGLQFLLGRILLRQMNLEGAFSAFSKALKLGLANSKIAPYLAEISFLQRRAA
jgi:hypothetical protein